MPLQGAGWDKDTALPLGFGQEAGGTPLCWLRWCSSFPRGGSVRKTAPHVPPHMLLLERLKFPLISFPKRDAGRRFAASAEWAKVSCRACAYSQPSRQAGSIRTTLLAGAWTKWEKPADFLPPKPQLPMVPDVSRLHGSFGRSCTFTY